MAPASCSLWPCCKQRVTSCLSLCLLPALSEGPCGCGRDGFTADPWGDGPPGPSPSCLPASAASAGGHCCGTRSTCRVPGLFTAPLCLFSTHTPPPRVQRHSQLPAGWLCYKHSPGLTASHSWQWTQVSHVSILIHTRTFTHAHNVPRTGMKAHIQTHLEMPAYSTLICPN